MLPPRRAALPLGTSSLGACGALLPREPRPVEGSRGSRPARRSCVPSLPTGGGGSLHRRSSAGSGRRAGGEGGRMRAVGICRDEACDRSEESARLRRGMHARTGEWADASVDERQRERIDAMARPEPRPSSSACRRRRSGDSPWSSRSRRPCMSRGDGPGQPDVVRRRGARVRPHPQLSTDSPSRIWRRPSWTWTDTASSGTARPSTCFSTRSAGRTGSARGSAASSAGLARGLRRQPPDRPAGPGRRPPRRGTLRPSRAPAVPGGLDGPGIPRSVSVSSAGTARRRPRPAGTP